MKRKFVVNKDVYLSHSKLLKVETVKKHTFVVFPLGHVLMSFGGKCLKHSSRTDDYNDAR